MSNRPFVRFPGGGARRPYGGDGRDSVGDSKDGLRPKKLIVVEPCESLKDANRKLLSVPINLEMELRENELPEGEARYDMINTMEIYREKFIETAHEFSIDIILNGEIQFISEGRRCFLPLEVASANWQSTLIRFAYSFFVGIRALDLYEVPIISTHSILLYPLRLIDGHINIPLARVQFGSILNFGQAGIHWTVIGGTRNGKWNDLFSFFNYDNLAINVEYNYRESDIDDRNESEVRGKISIDMTSINRIFIDQVEEPDQNRRISLVLLLDSPPKLQAQRRTGKHESGPKAPWEYRNELQRGKFPGERSQKEALHDSKAVFLEFDEFELKLLVRDGDVESTLDSLFYDMISRLRQKTGRKIEFASFYQTEMLEGTVKCPRDGRWREQTPMISVNPYDVWPDFDETARGFITRAAEQLVFKGSRMDREMREYHIRSKEFFLRALLQGILDRGMEIRMELLRDRSTWYNFVESVSEDYAREEGRTLHALERVMEVLDEGKRNCAISVLYRKEWTDSTPIRRAALFSEQAKKEGYFRIMKVVVTPTRTWLSGYEVIMGNRIIHKYAKNHHIIRLIFRDDNGGLVWISKLGPSVQARLKHILLDGITYAGRYFEFLGHSNSQLRDQGCYMIHVDSRRFSISPHDIRCQMGEFYSLPNIPKMMARLGQVFTQSKPSEMTLSPSEIGVSFDAIGGRNSAGEPYIFSDGVGGVSAQHAAKLSKKHGCTASAFQIRFKGAKGLVSVDPLIDERNNLLKMMGKYADMKVYLRPSMNKFEVTEEISDLEIVKYSSSTMVFLNRPFINILCQVSEWQSAECHQRIRGRVKGLMHVMLREVFQSFYDEHKASEVIRELSFPILMEVFTPSSGFNFTTDPFFRHLLLANAKYVIKKQLGKMSINIPSSSGRSMLGVVDTTGILQYGQIFCQYSGSVSKQGGRAKLGCGRGIILTGSILVTKNPCISAGDVRMFEAVDIGALRHLIDVIVFPMHGPRPHPDEMAGSDLDGDEYTVIWDKELFLERNEEASVFPSGEEKTIWAIPRNEITGAVDIQKCEEMKADFYTEAITHGQPGLMSTAHLVISDLYGLDSKPAKSLATKIAQTLDYQKTGIKPADMTKETVDDPEIRHETRVIPAEISKMKPDFLRHYKEPGYESRGILGEVFREASLYDHLLDSEEDHKEEIIRDSSFCVDGWEKYENITKRELTSYSNSMKSVFEHYGMKNDEELLSGAIITMKNRLSDKEDHGGTMFTTNKVIEEAVKRIIEEARERFFDSFFDWKKGLDEFESKRSDVRPDSVLHRIVRSHTEHIEKFRRKASAAYNVAYAAANHSAQRGEQCAILLSFPWIFYDVLMDIKQNATVALDDATEQSNHPLARNLSKLIDRYCEEPSKAKRYSDFMGRFENDSSIVAQSMKENEGLARVCFVLLEWATYVEAISEEFREEHLLSLFVVFGLGSMGTPGSRKKFIQKPCGDQRRHLKKGEHLLLFLDFVSSEEFRNVSSLSFADVNGGVLLRGQWKAFSEIALSSFLSLVTSHRLDLPMAGGNIVVATILRDYEPREMQLPEYVITSKLEEMQSALLKVSECKAINLRRLHPQVVIVSAIGTSKQLRVLTSFIYPPAPSRETATLKGTIESLSKLTYERLMKAAQKLNSH